TRRIAQAAGVNEVPLFRRFGTKQALVTRAVAREAGRVIARLAPTGDLQADLVGACRVYRDLLVERAPFIAVLVSEAPRHPELAGVLRGPLDVIGAVAGIIARGQEAGLLEAEPPIHAAAVLLTPLLGLALLGRAAAVNLPPLDLDRHVQRFIRGRTPAEPAAQEKP
ncbi:MAG TPA: hypothetical protein VHN99_11975, partial [Deinococcales bacterium]|nr:hypothetical protein [Deinococcales bacterium]